MPRRLRRLAALSLGILGFLGCPSGDNNGPDPIPVTVDRVTVSPSTVNLLVGAQQALSATALAANGTPIAGKAAAWSSTNTSAATVNATTGLVTAVGAGTAVITAVIDGRTGQSTVEVTVPTQRLTVTTSGTGSGTVTSSPAGINCSRAAGVQTGECAFDFPQGSVVTLTATAAAGGHSFGGWTGEGCTGLGPCQVTLSQARQVGALVRPPQHTLSVVLSGTGSMTMTSLPTGILCVLTAGVMSGVCSASFDQGTVVTLSRTSPALNLMTSWGGPGSGCGSGLECMVTMSQTWMVTATVLAPATLGVTIAGAGRVTSQPEGIDCQRSAEGVVTGTCATSLVATTSRRLTATPATGFQFTGWTGASCPGTGHCDVTPVGAETVTATFTPSAPNPVLSVAANGSGSGVITSTPAGIACTVSGGVTSGTCSMGYPTGTIVSLGIQAGVGSAFTGWSGGGCAGTGACQVTVNQSTQVTATILPLVPVTVVTGGNGNGTVTGSPAGINCTRTGGVQSGACGILYPQGATITLTAQAASGSTFTGWAGDGCSGTGTCIVQATQARTVTATFSLTGGTGLGVGFGPDQFVAISAGTFVMGSNTGFTPEQPAHSVTLTAGYQIQKTEVTQGQWRQVMGTSPSAFSSCGDLCPVENVSWNDVQLFLTALNAQTPGQNYRLPTEAEWEFAARAGTTTDYSGTGVIDQMGWYAANSGNVTHPVAQKLPNAWGLFDVHGNVREWTSNWYEDYTASATTNPTGPASGAERVLRSGPFDGAASFVRSSVRARFVPSSRDNTTGFRLVKGGMAPASVSLIATPGSRAFQATQNGTLPAALGVSVTASSGAVGALTTSTTYLSGNAWLTATFNQTMTPATLTLQPATTALGPGTYQASVTISGTGATAATVSVSYQIAAPAPLGTGFGPEQFVLISPGTFLMGSNTGESYEQPVHQVTLTNAFRMQRTEVTLSQWRQLMGSDPGLFPGCAATCPVTNVTWNEVQTFLATLNQLDPGKGYRLPTEAEWEYAARAGTTGDITGNGNLSDMGWYNLNSQNTPWPVAQKLPNAWGLYDTHGNASEWVQDWWQAYPATPQTNPIGPLTGTARVARGGSFYHDPLSTRTPARLSGLPDARYFPSGFRLVRNP